MKAAHYIGNRTFTVDACEPSRPSAGEVRLQVAYCGICGTDLHVYHGDMDRRVKIPQVLGHEMSGTVAEIGDGVEGLAVGDAVVVRPLDTRGETEADCGFSHICHGLKFMGIDSPGALQGSWNVPAFTVHKLPAGTDLKLAALTEPLAVACHDVRMAGLAAGELAVVLGGGPIGMLIALVARQFGAQVILSEISDFRLQLARRLGLEAIDPRTTDLAALVLERTQQRGADVVFEVSGSKAAMLSAPELLRIRGRLLLVAIYSQPIEINLFHYFWKELRLQGARVYEREDYERAIQLIAVGTLPLEQIITTVLPLNELAHAFITLDSNPAAMKILIDCGGVKR
jgi:(R,R)-butanediol dehydrogenase/meso-butanediol dehydrogenase/diacetyl reductase